MSQRLISRATELKPVCMEDLDRLEDFFGDIRRHDSRYFPDSGKLYSTFKRNNVDVDTIPQDVIEPFLIASEGWLMLNAFMRISYQKSLVLPHDYHRGDIKHIWHFDMGEEDLLRAAVFSDCLPLQSVTLNSKSKQEVASIKVGQDNKVNPKQVDKMIQRGVLCLQPETSPLIGRGIDENTLHASKANDSDAPVMRRFFRISRIVHKSKLEEVLLQVNDLQ